MCAAARKLAARTTKNVGTGPASSEHRGPKSQAHITVGLWYGHRAAPLAASWGVWVCPPPSRPTEPPPILGAGPVKKGTTHGLLLVCCMGKQPSRRRPAAGSGRGTPPDQRKIFVEFSKIDSLFSHVSKSGVLVQRAVLWGWFGPSAR